MWRIGDPAQYIQDHLDERKPHVAAARPLGRPRTLQSQNVGHRWSFDAEASLPRRGLGTETPFIARPTNVIPPTPLTWISCLHLDQNEPSPTGTPTGLEQRMPGGPAVE